MIRSVLFATVLVGAAAMPESSVAPSPSASSQILSAFNHLSMLVKPSSFRFDAPAYRMETVKRGEIITTVQAAGTLNALVVVEVGSQLSGRVKELYADFNSEVTQGQVIARVEPEIYEARVAQAQAELEMAETHGFGAAGANRTGPGRTGELPEAKHASAMAQNTRAEVALDDARKIWSASARSPKEQRYCRRAIGSGSRTRTDRPRRRSHPSRAEELSQAAAIRAAEAALNMAEAQLANTLAQVKQKEAVLRQAQIDLDRTYIRAPVTGTVVNRAVSGGQTLAASLQTPTLFTIAQDLTQMQVEASVVEADISRFEVGQPVTFTVDAYPGRVFTGDVKQIRKAPQVVQNVVTYMVVIAAENPDERAAAWHDRQSAGRRGKAERRAEGP